MADGNGITLVANKQAQRLYLPQLDSMRFFAFLSVFLFHGLPSNDVSVHTGVAKTIAMVEAIVHRSLENGVGLFFLLSAYLITEILRRESIATGSVHLLRFYFRRSLRIWPLYYLAVAIGLILQTASPAFSLSRTGILAFIFFWKNWDLALHGPTWNPIYILWTVSAEEQFYAVWPVAQKYVRGRAMPILCGVLIAVVACVAFWPSGYFFRTYNSQVVYLFLYFPVGALIALGLGGRQYLAPKQWCLSLTATGLLLWIGGTFLSYPAHEVPGIFAWFLLGRAAIVAGTIAIFMGFYLSAPSWSPKATIYLGRVSYGLYVFHVMALLIALKLCQSFGLLVGKSTFGTMAAGLAFKLMIGFALTVVFAVVSYEFYEKRFLNLKDKLAFVPSRPVYNWKVSTPGPDRGEGGPESGSHQASSQP